MRRRKTGRVRGGAGIVAGMLCCGFATPAHAALPPPNTNYNAGISLVVSLGPAEDRARFGVGLDGQIQRFHHERPYWSGRHRNLGPLGTLAAHVTWTRPVVSMSLTGALGAMYPQRVYDTGYIVGAGLQAQAGLAMATDGAVGPVLGAVGVGPMSEIRVETMWWKGWHDPRLAVGPMLTLSGYGTYL